MIKNIFTEDPEISPKPPRQEEYQLFPQITRRDRYSSNQTPTDQGPISPPAKKRKKIPSSTAERAKKKTSLTRTLPAHAKIVQGPLLRQFQDDSENGNGNMMTVDFTADDAKDLSMEILKVFEGVSENLLTGSSLGPLKEDFVKLFSSLEEKNALCEAMLMLYEKHRLIPLLKARAQVSGYLVKCAQRNDLTPAEALAFFKIFGDEISSIRESSKEFSSAPLKDVEALLEKIDFNDVGNLRDLAKQFAGTTPQGREIIRRVIHELKMKVEKAQAAEQVTNETESKAESGQDQPDQCQCSEEKKEATMPAESAETTGPECPLLTPPFQETENIENTRPASIFTA